MATDRLLRLKWGGRNNQGQPVRVASCDGCGWRHMTTYRRVFTGRGASTSKAAADEYLTKRFNAHPCVAPEDSDHNGN